ncbi:MAG: type II secretion system F family protein [Tardiphaga sp.]
MMSSLAFAPTPTVLVFLAAVTLVISGATLIATGVRHSRLAVAQRVDLVRPRTVAAPEKGQRAFEKVAFSQGKGVPESEQREIIRRLSGLGIPAVYATSFFTGGKVLAAVAFGQLMLFVASHITAIANFSFAMPLAIAAGGVAGWLLPGILIGTSARRRAKEVAAAMPEALDLLVICVDAGLSLEDALSRVVIELGQSRPALADELALTSADLQILPSRSEALTRMAERVDMPSITLVVTTLSQTLQYGTPLAQALRSIASQMRDDALIQLEERANQLPAILTVPMMLFIMPTIFLVVGGPAALQLMDILGKR